MDGLSPLIYRKKTHLPPGHPGDTLRKENYYETDYSIEEHRKIHRQDYH